MNIIGQENLINIINRLEIDSFPRSIILLGEQGSGKHLISSYISDHLKLNLVDISEKLNLECINEIYLKSEPVVYLIDAKKITIKDENTILKFLEEPLKNAFIIILCENKATLLDTIINRCQVWKLENYKQEDLVKFIDKPLENDSLNKLLTLARTPGRIRDLQLDNISAYYELADKFINKISIANFQNSLSLIDKFAFEDEKDKLDPLLFLDCNMIMLENNLKLAKNEDINKCVIATQNTKYKASLKNISLKYLISNYIMEIWCIMHHEGEYVNDFRRS